MDFAQCLRQAAPATPPAPGNRAWIRVALGLGGLALLPFVSGAVPGGPAVRVMAALALACGLAFAALRTLARRSAASAAVELRVVARASLSPRNALAVVEADGRRYFIAYGDGYTQLLAASPPEAGRAAPEPAKEAHA